MLIGGLKGTMSAYGSLSMSSQTWGRSGYVHDYYDSSPTTFQQNSNMFNYGNTAMMNMQSTSTIAYTAGTFSTVASNIEAGTTIEDYQEEYVARSSARRGMGGNWAPPVFSPIGDGWDVILFLIVLAVGYGVVSVRKKQSEALIETKN